MICGGFHLFVIFQHKLMIVKMSHVYIQQTDYSVQRRADIMAHAAEKVGFRFVCTSCLCGNILKLFLICQLPELLLGDITGRYQNMSDPAVLVTLLCDQCHLIPKIAPRLEIMIYYLLVHKTFPAGGKIQKLLRFLTMLRNYIYIDKVIAKVLQ